MYNTYTKLLQRYIAKEYFINFDIDALNFMHKNRIMDVNL